MHGAKSTERPRAPRHVQELFDFQRVAALAPGAVATLRFTLPPEVAGTVAADGAIALTPGRFRVRIGDVPRHSGSPCGSACVEGVIEIKSAQGHAAEVAPAPRIA